ncbi:MAG TPA: hypothetical protein PLP17_03940 [Oligoflexia bacterium]|nr:hypothetical protein [Oligoflexia bacterium]
MGQINEKAHNICRITPRVIAAAVVFWLCVPGATAILLSAFLAARSRTTLSGC